MLGHFKNGDRLKAGLSLAFLPVLVKACCTADQGLMLMALKSAKYDSNPMLAQRPGQRIAQCLASRITTRQLWPQNWSSCLILVTIILLGWTNAAAAQSANASPPAAIGQLKVMLDAIWVVITALLVFFMNAGFAMLETGLCRQKSAVNVLAKTLIGFALTTVAFWTLGFGLMFGDGTPFLGTNGWLLQGSDNSPMIAADYQGIFSALSWAAVPLNAKFFFHLALAGISAAIVSGAIAERVKFIAFLIFSLLLVGFCYPVTGHWVWGGGWLAAAGFSDFAGATVVHSVGGWAALTGTVILGPRLGHYLDEGRTIAMPGHNMAIATLGCFILWLGWFGFNSGATLAADPNAITHIILTTNTGAAFGGTAATATAWLYLGKPDLSVIINGILAGLVGITASCAFVSLGSAAVIGAISGILVVFAVTFFDQLRIDDPVGAISVHLVCGIWGTLALGLFAVGPDVYTWYSAQGGPVTGFLLGGGLGALSSQILGILAVAGFTVLFSTAIWLVLQATLGIRVSPEAEVAGLGIAEHGMEAYSGFQKEEVR